MAILAEMARPTSNSDQALPLWIIAIAVCLIACLQLYGVARVEQQASEARTQMQRAEREAQKAAKALQDQLRRGKH